MSLSLSTVQKMIIALAGKNSGNELATAVNLGSAHAAASAASIPLAVVATSTSATTNFAALAVGDLLVHIPATAGNAVFETVATAGTKPSAAVVGDLYIAIRAFAAPAASNVVI